MAKQLSVARYSSLRGEQAERMRELETENYRLKKAVAELASAAIIRRSRTRTLNAEISDQMPGPDAC
jgi:hypothetical protein